MWLHKLHKNKRGISTVIAVILSLVILVVVVENVVLWSYQMNQYDWERMHEDLSFTVTLQATGALFSFKNDGPVTWHVVSLWVINSTIHSHYSVDYFINSGMTSSFINADIHLPRGPCMVKTITERGNIAVYSIG